MQFKDSSKLLALLFAGALTFTACGDDDPADPDDPMPPSVPDKPITPEKPEQGEALTPTIQKARLDTIAMDFMKQTPASDFDNMAKLANHIDHVYNEDNYNWSNVESWAKGVWNGLKKSLGTTTTEEEKYGTSVYRYVYTNYTTLLMASNFTGHFTAQNGGWELTKANDLQFTFTDHNGSPCTLKVETGGNVKKVYVMNIDDWKDYGYDNVDGNYVMTDYYDRVQCTIGVPERIMVSLTQGGSEVVKVALNIDLNSIQGDKFDLSKSALTLKGNVTLNNGYTVDLSQVNYTGNQKASASGVVKKNGNSLATFAVSGDLSGIPSCNLDAFIQDEGFGDANTNNMTAKDVFVKLDVMGKLQIQGKLTDFRKYADYIEMADNSDDNEATFKSYISQANALMDLNLFYDNKATKQANVKLESFRDDDYYGAYWYTEPVLQFFDGSSYSTFDAFFNDKDFKDVIDAFENLMKDYENLVK